MRTMVRLGILALLIVLVGGVIVGAGIVAPISGILLIVFGIAYALVPEFRRRANRLWLWHEVTGMYWWPFGWGDPEPRERDPDDPNRGDHLL